MKTTSIQHPEQPSNMHDARHPLRRNLTRVEHLFVDINREVKLSDLSEELTQSVRQMAARKSSDQAFWLHAFKFLNDFKDDIYTRYWSDKIEANHQARLVLAQRSAAIQIRLLIRDKHLPPDLQSALAYMFGPALALLMLRRSNDRQSRTLINAMQLVYEVIENHQESPISLDPYNRPAKVGLKQRLHDFFKGITGIRQALTPEVLTQLQGNDGYFLAVLGDEGRQSNAIELTSPTDKNSMADVPDSLNLPLHENPEDFKHADIDSEPEPLSVQQNALSTTHKEDKADDTPSETEVLESMTANEAEHKHDAENTASFMPQDASEAPIESDKPAPTHPALDALLEKIMQEHRFTWFQTQACKESRLRRLMFGSYEREHQLVILVNVRQEPSLALSVADFDASLKAGFTRPLYDEPELEQLLLNYLARKEALASAMPLTNP